MPRELIGTEGGLIGRRLRVLVSFLLASAPMAFGEWEFSGVIGSEARIFTDSAAFADQFDGAQFSLTFEPELSWEGNDGRNQAGLVLFARVDSEDDERSHFDVREAYLRTIRDDWEIMVGLNSIFWGVTESRHLVNIINQIDQVEATDEEDFLGQPMLQISRQTGIGRFGAFVLPGFRERTFPGSAGRFRGPVPVDDDAARYESEDGKWHVDYALRYSHFFGDWDIGLSYFYGTSREPRFVPSADATRLNPFYDLIHQFGVELQYTRDSWLWKFEGIVREGQGDTFAALVGGFDYTLYQTFGGNADLGLLVEYLYDERDDVLAPPTMFDNDLFFGSRLALNDVQDTALLVGVVVDLDDRTTSFRVEAERRLGKHYKLEIEAQALTNVHRGNAAYAFRRDSYLQISLSRFF